MFGNRHTSNLLNSITSTIKNATHVVKTEELNGRQIRIESKIAEGGFGIIHSGVDNFGQRYAIKTLRAHDREMVMRIKQEYRIQSMCSGHPNVVQVFGIKEDYESNSIKIYMEYCPETCIGEMNSVFNIGFDTYKIVKIFESVCDAVNFMHELDPPISHRDLKAENILKVNGIYKLCDFGSATTEVYTLSSNKERDNASDDIQKNTTPTHRAPEMCDLFRRDKIDTKADVWALGCVLFKLCTFEDAFPEGSNLQILNCRYKWPDHRSIDPRLKSLVEKCFVISPEQRPTVRQILGELYRMFPDCVNPKWRLEEGQGVVKPDIQTNEQPCEPPQPIQPPQPSPNEPLQGQSSTASEHFHGDPFSQPQHDPTSQQTVIDSYSEQNNSEFLSEFQQFPVFSSEHKPFTPQVQQTTSFELGTQNLFEQPNNDIFDIFSSSSNSTLLPVETSQWSPFSMKVPDRHNSNETNVGSSSTQLPFKLETEPLVRFDVELISEISVDPSRLQNDMEKLANEILEMDDIKIKESLEAYCYRDESNFVTFIFYLIHRSGERSSKVLSNLPNFSSQVLNRYAELRKSFAFDFPQFEGNFSLVLFAKKNKSSPPPIGQPPICLDTLNRLMDIIEVSIQLAGDYVDNTYVAESAFFSYQISAYITAKLIMRDCQKEHVIGDRVPMLASYHLKLKECFSTYKSKIPFPDKPFDFNDSTVLRNLRSPSTISLV